MCPSGRGIRELIRGGNEGTLAGGDGTLAGDEGILLLSIGKIQRNLVGVGGENSTGVYGDLIWGIDESLSLNKI